MCVGRRELVGIQFILRDPREGGTPDGAWFVPSPGALEELKPDRLLGIAMRDRLDELANLNLDPELLHQFATQRLLEGFAGFSFAPGEFPQSGQMSASRALGDEEFSVPKNQSGADLNDFSRCWNLAQDQSKRSVESNYRPTLL